MTSTYKFQWLDVAINIETDCPQASDAIVALFGGQRAADSIPVTQSLGCRVLRQGQGWSIHWQDGKMQDCSSLAKLMVRLEYKWFMAIQKHHAGQYLFFHASALSIEGRTFLVAGGPDAGKTTLALHASESGNVTIGDELIAVNPQTRKLSGLRRGLKLNQAQAGTLLLDADAHLLPAHTVHWADEDWHGLDAIVVLQPNGGAAPQTLSPPNAAQALYPHCLNSLSFAKGGMQEVTSLVAAVPALELGRTAPDTMITALRDWRPRKTDSPA